MDNKLSELSKPVAEVVSKFGDPEAFGEREIKLLTGIQQMAYGTKFYSQEYVSALLAELEFEKQNNAGVAGMVEDYETKLAEKDKRIAELEEQKTKWVGWSKELGAKLDTAEKRLATPIKIVNYDEFFICHVSGASDDYCKGWVDGRNAAARDVGKAGFTVEDRQ
ncbi:hypothetical protein OSC18_26545 [Serratia nevei]|uniref:hypothetical protein n=1 Tax=Serratia nevei TaxID=2703794 RepID=UPI00285BD164|nr:hypothetical protein [Serratia nevei]MDR8493035.1 hypothetical protein [Serratia nevei]